MATKTESKARNAGAQKLATWFANKKITAEKPAVKSARAPSPNNDLLDISEWIGKRPTAKPTPEEQAASGKAASMARFVASERATAAKASPRGNNYGIQ
jgi:predicted secreted protein